jgi:hypothetical protein
MAIALLKPPLDVLLLPAGDALAFVDSATGEAVTAGLRCSLVLRRGGKLLGRAMTTPTGVHHWPELSERWRDPDPAAPVFADVVVRDERERFQPLSLPWPLPAAPVGQVIGGTVLGGARLLRVSLLSAPARRPPPGMASVHGQLLWQADGAPVAWARVSYFDGDGRVHDGASDAEGRLSLHLPSPRPNRPGSPPAPAAQLRVFADPALAAASLGLGAPDVLAFAAQPEVRALADVAASGAYAPPAFIPGEPLILATLGLPPAHRELRLAPI